MTVKPKRKVVRMKPYRTLQVLDEKGRPICAPEDQGTTIAKCKIWMRPGERVATVEVREITK